MSTVSLSTHRRQRSLLLSLLYFCQGLPWGFANIALLSLMSEAGHSKAATATLVALTTLPWTFKFFWAPMIDSLRFPAMGLRRPWIMFAQTCMAITLIAAVSSGQLEQADTLTYLAWVFFVHNCFASLQDVATDALAIDLLDDNERGRVNGIMWGSKLFGIAVGGAGMATLIARSGIEFAVSFQVCVLLLVLLLVTLWKERAVERFFPWSAGFSGSTLPKNIGFFTTLRELLRALSTRTTAMLTLVAVSMLVCEGLYDPLTTEFFIQRLNWSAEKYSQIQGTIGVFAELSGALIGGWLCDRFGQRRIVAFGLTVIAATLLCFSLTSAMWEQSWYPHTLLIPLFRGFMALITVSMFSLYMKVSWTTAAATQFTLYMSLNNIGFWFGARLLTWTEGSALFTTLQDYYLFAGFLPFIPMILLFTFDPAARSADKPAPA